MDSILARQAAWKAVAAGLSRFKWQICLLTGTLPPGEVEAVYRLLRRRDFNIFRLPSDRHNISLHNVPAYTPSTRTYCHEDVAQKLIKTLQDLSNPQGELGKDRILVFFPNTEQVERFAKSENYLWYHSKEGNALMMRKVMESWDEGKSNVMVASTALAQGLDKENIRYVLAVDIHFGISLLSQMMGRAGRDEEASDVYFISHPSQQKDSDMEIFANPWTCHREDMMNYLDGPGLSYRCTAAARWVNYCGNCAPTAPMHQIGLQAASDAQACVKGAEEERNQTRQVSGPSKSRPLPGTSNLATVPPPASSRTAGSKAAPSRALPSSQGSSFYWEAQSEVDGEEAELACRAAEESSVPRVCRFHFSSHVVYGPLTFGLRM